MIQISPSVLSADFTHLADTLKTAEEAGADRIHIDVMDGHFVPNITMGPFIVEAINSATTLPLEVHLMIDHPDRYMDAFIQAGADILIVHQENVHHLHRVIQYIKAQGKQAGVALNPGTPVHTLDEVINDLDMALVMSVNPGFSGQKFIPSMLKKMRQLRQLIEDRRLSCDLEVDGGVTTDNAREIADAGVNILVAATAIFKHPDGLAEGIHALRHRAEDKTLLV